MPIAWLYWAASLNSGPRDVDHLPTRAGHQNRSNRPNPIMPTSSYENAYEFRLSRILIKSVNHMSQYDKRSELQVNVSPDSTPFR